MLKHNIILEWSTVVQMYIIYNIISVEYSIMLLYSCYSVRVSVVLISPKTGLMQLYNLTNLKPTSSCGYLHLYLFKNFQYTFTFPSPLLPHKLPSMVMLTILHTLGHQDVTYIWFYYFSKVSSEGPLFTKCSSKFYL